MIKFTNCLTIICAILTFSSLPAMSKEALNLPTIQIPARAIGMGRAAVSLADYSACIFTNPAGLGFSKNWGLTSMSTQLLGNVNYLLFGTSAPTTFGVVGLGILSATAPAGYYTTTATSLADAPAINYNDLTIIMSFGKKIDNPIVPNWMGDMSLGGALKYYLKSFSGTSVSAYRGTGFDADIGMLLQVDGSKSVGIYLQNFMPLSMGGAILWDSNEKESIPAVLKIGASVKTFEERITMAGDAFFSRNENQPTTLHLGGEYAPIPNLAIRAGIDQNTNAASRSAYAISSNLTFGVGLLLQDMRFDYAYVQDPTLSNNNITYFSISFLRTPAYPEETPPPPTASPTKESVTGLEENKTETRDPEIKKLQLMEKELDKKIPVKKQKPTPQELKKEEKVNIQKLVKLKKKVEKRLVIQRAKTNLLPIQRPVAEEDDDLLRLIILQNKIEKKLRGMGLKIDLQPSETATDENAPGH